MITFVIRFRLVVVPACCASEAGVTWDEAGAATRREQVMGTTTFRRKVVGPAALVHERVHLLRWLRC